MNAALYSNKKPWPITEDTPIFDPPTVNRPEGRFSDPRPAPQLRRDEIEALAFPSLLHRALHPLRRTSDTSYKGLSAICHLSLTLSPQFLPPFLTLLPAFSSPLSTLTRPLAATFQGIPTGRVLPGRHQ